MSKKKKKNVKVPRNLSIFKSFQREINLQTKVVSSKNKYSRKSKHRAKEI